MTTTTTTVAAGGGYSMDIATHYSDDDVSVSSDISLVSASYMTGFTLTIKASDGATAEFVSRGNPHFILLSRGSTGLSALEQLLNAANGTAPPKPETEHESVMVRIEGKMFRCICGCNVFHHDNDLIVCNACGQEYDGK